MTQLASEVAEIVIRSVVISGSATLLASTWSIPLALRLALSKSRAGRAITDVLSALTSVPTVVIGLVLYLLLSRAGPLGFLGLLYTPVAISIGQAILITPLITSMAIATLAESQERVWEMAISMGATERQAALTVLSESLPAIVTVVLLGFNRAVGELGIALMLGGNIRGMTRVMTTAIALEVAKGEFELALTLGGVLLAMTLSLNVLVRRLGGAK